MIDKAKAEEALRSLETDEERAEREAAEAAAAASGEKPRRGRPPGSTNKPKISEEALTAGCASLVQFIWTLSAIPPRVLGIGTLQDLEAKELEEGTAQMRELVRRYSALVVVLTVVGFPLWMVRMFALKFKRTPAADATVNASAQRKAA
jgi:hypothetical protein